MTRTALHPVEKVLAENGRGITRGGKPRHQRRHPERQAQADTLVLPAVEDVAGPHADEQPNELDELAADMAYVGAIVQRPDREPNGDCRRCDRMGALAEVTVTSGDEPEEMCRFCTPTFVVSEISTGQHRRPVVVEIPKAVSA